MNFRGIALASLALAATGLRASEVIPPAPAAHFNDYASLIGPSTAARLEQELDQFERQTSNQVLVAIFPSMQSDSSVEDYTVRVAQAWRAGLKGRDNGAILFVFVQSHQMYIQVGYGLEGSLTDATCRRIIADEITPAFKKGNYDQGVSAGVAAILAATRGEYKGTGSTVADQGARQSSLWPLLFIVVVVVVLSYVRRQAYVYSGRGRGGFGTGMLAGMMLGGGGGGFSGGGGFGGGGFSGGGGGFGGGGAGGSW